MKYNNRIAAIFIATSLALAGCTSIAQFAANTAQSLSSSTPAQARTLDEAVQAATLVTKAATLYVNTANPSRATLEELKILDNQVHTSLVNLQNANAAGQSLAIASFNEALAAFLAYSTSKGIPK